MTIPSDYEERVYAGVLGKIIGVYLGRGDGTVQARITTPAGLGPRYLAVQDFDGDGLLDVATNNINDNSVSVLTGTGNGGFAASLVLAVGLNPGSVAAGDFNGDGLPDLVTPNVSDDTISVLLNTTH